MIILALLSQKASLTLAASLTVVLLPWALLTVWQRRNSQPVPEIRQWALLLAGMTLAMLGMMWRGEAWKAGCLSAESQLSQLLQQSPQSSPKTASCDRAAVILYGERDLAAPEFPPSEQQRDHLRQSSVYRPARSSPEAPKSIPDMLVNPRSTGSESWLALLRPYVPQPLTNPAFGDQIRTRFEVRGPTCDPAHKNHTESEATPLHWCCRRLGMEIMGSACSLDVYARLVSASLNCSQTSRPPLALRIEQYVVQCSQSKTSEYVILPKMKILVFPSMKSFAVSLSIPASLELPPP